MIFLPLGQLSVDVKDLGLPNVQGRALSEACIFMLLCVEQRFSKPLAQKVDTLLDE